MAEQRSGDGQERGNEDGGEMRHGHGVGVASIDIAITSEPRFVEKSVLLSSSSYSSSYSSSPSSLFSSGSELETDTEDTMSTRNSSTGTGTETEPGSGSRNVYAHMPQWWLLGFDTLRRLVDGKYYPPSGSLEVLAPLFEGVRVGNTVGKGNRVVVVKRGEGDSNSEQDRFIRGLSLGREVEGGFRGVGWNVDWGGRVDVVDGFEGGVSSTAVREAMGRGNREGVKGMCGGGVAEYIRREGLYVES